MSSYVFQFFCGDGKGGAPTPTQMVPAPATAPAPAQLALPASAPTVPPPRPRPTVAPPGFPTRSSSRQSRRSLRSQRSQRSRTPSRSARSRARLTSNVPEPMSSPPGQWEALPNSTPPVQPVQQHISSHPCLPLAGFTLLFLQRHFMDQ